MAGRSHSPPIPSSVHERVWPRRLLIGVLVLANVVVFGGAAFVWYFAERASSQIATISIEDLPSIDAAPARSSGPRNFLVIGSDSREMIPEDLPGKFGDFPGQRADVIMVVHLVPGEDRAQVLSIPRDLKVEIAGHGTDKINAAYSLGGPDLMVQTVKAVTDLPIHHYVEIDFVGFAGIVDALGGVDMYFPYAARDVKSGFEVEAGTTHLDGPGALGFVRSRTYQESQGGNWVSVEADDLGRIQRQQRLMLAIIEEAKRPSTITELSGLIDALGQHLKSDSALNSGALIQLAWDMRSLSVENTDATALPVVPAGEGGVSYVVPEEPAASEVLAAFAAGKPLTTALEEPSRLRVLNGNGVSGAAAEMAERLREEGFTVVDVGDAERKDYQETLVIARPDELARAEAIIAELGFGEILPGEISSDLDVIIIVGLDAAPQA